MVRRLIYILTAFIGMAVMASCHDEPIMQGGGYIGEGQATAHITVNFKPFGSALDGKSRTAGNAIKAINSLYVLLYDTEGKFISMYDATKQVGYKVEDESRKNNSVGTKGEHIAEDATPCATFSMNIPYGQYRIYAVANYDIEILETDCYDTDEKLAKLPLTWNSTDISKNNQMFGYFTNEKVNSKPTGWQATSVTINQSTVNLYAWIRRAASKVTVAYDATNLNENIFIYLKSVTIKDIPKECYLGAGNAVATDEQRPGISNELLENGETIYYGGAQPEHTEADFEKWPRIAKGNPFYYYTTDTNNPTSLENAHTEDMNALFFFENMQPDYKDLQDKKNYDKRQDAWNTNGEETADGKLDEPGLTKEGDPGWKDNVKYGTYIEVEAYYYNLSEANVSRGKITYRFMLGKDVTYNYSAERNYHYKLTLKFMGNANDVDWHIKYEEEEGIYIPNPWYVSYLYGQKTMMPLKVVGKIKKTSNGQGYLYAEIKESHWYPHKRTGETQPTEYWKGDVYTAYDGYDDNGNLITAVGDGPWNGFLSLYPITSENGPNNTWKWNDGSDGENNYSFWKNNSIGIRYYELSSTSQYQVEKNGDDSYVFNIPLWTRQKNLITGTGFTGNNVNVASLRMATVEFSARIDDGTTEEGRKETETINIVQVRRMVNPKGIYRSHDNAEPFRVRLMYQETEGSDFVPLKSEGEWSATIIDGGEDWNGNKWSGNGKKWIKLNGKLGGEVKGATGSIVDFEYAPEGTIASNEVRCGIIRVTYHNNSCTHLIMVRQGYAPLDVAGDGAEWYSYNMYDKNNLTKSPLEEGSLFKHGNWNDAILASNNETYEFEVNPNGDMFKMADGTNKTWANITFDDTFETNGNYRLPTYNEWNNLKGLEFGCGVLYGDGATETAASLNVAYGYNFTGGEKNGYGMRGYIVYNPNDGRNVFFPIGYTGYGRRKRYFSSTSVYGEEKAGTLRYAQRTNYYEKTNEIEYRPMFWNIYKSFGAIYWRQQGGTDGGHAWDMNYHTLDFSDFENNAYPSNDSDACFIRCVVNE